MLQLRSKLKVADNTGARSLGLFSVAGKRRRRFVGIGDIVTCSVKEADPKGSVRKGEVVHAVIIRTRKEKRRKDGSYVRFDDNAAVIIDKGSKEPKGTRIFGPVPRELKELGFGKIISLADEVV
jgi:large subunit ribosomal protein L14